MARTLLLVDAARAMGRVAAFDDGQALALRALRRLEPSALSPSDCCRAANVCGYYAVGEDIVPGLIDTAAAAPPSALSAAASLHAVEASARWGLAASGDHRLLTAALSALAALPSPVTGVALPAALDQEPRAPPPLDAAASAAFAAATAATRATVLWRVAAASLAAPGWPGLAATTAAWARTAQSCSADDTVTAAKVLSLLVGRGDAGPSAGLIALVTVEAHRLTLHAAVQTAEAIAEAGAAGQAACLLRVLLLHAGAHLVAARDNPDTVLFAQRWLLCSLRADLRPRRAEMRRAWDLLRRWPAFGGPFAATVRGDPALLSKAASWDLPLYDDA